MPGNLSVIEEDSSTFIQWLTSRSSRTEFNDKIAHLKVKNVMKEE